VGSGDGTNFGEAQRLAEREHGGGGRLLKIRRVLILLSLSLSLSLSLYRSPLCLWASSLRIVGRSRGGEKAGLGSKVDAQEGNY
jgi:hypothetical protein